MCVCDTYQIWYLCGLNIIIISHCIMMPSISALCAKINSNSKPYSIVSTHNPDPNTNPNPNAINMPVFIRKKIRFINPC